MKLKNKQKKRYLFTAILLVTSMLLSYLVISGVAANATAITDNTTARTYRSVAYFTSWGGYERAVEVGDIDPTLLTHINFAFANLSSNGTVTVGDPWIDTEKPYGDDTWETELRGHFGQLIKLKEQYPHIKTVISIGGWTWSTNFSAVAASDALRKACAQSAVDFVVKYGFDGVDLDWEYPVQGGNNIPHRPDDGDNYILLLKEIRNALDAQGEKDGKEYVLSIAGAADSSFIANCRVAQMMQYLDYINVMTYDYHGTWDTTTNHATPLYTDPGDTSGLCTSDTIEKYIDAGVAPADLNLGLALYGKGWINVNDPGGTGLHKSGKAATSAGYGYGTWEGSNFDYWDLAANYIGKNNYTRYWDDSAKMPYLFNGSTFITYEDEESMGCKLDYIKAMGLGGAMFWEFSCDKTLVLQSLIADRLNINEEGNGSDPTETPKIGDINVDGFVDSIDFALLKSFLLGKSTLQNTPAADINNDSNIDALDLLNLKMTLLEISAPQP
jgi:chitinase